MNVASQLAPTIDWPDQTICELNFTFTLKMISVVASQVSYLQGIFTMRVFTGCCSELRQRHRQCWRLALVIRENAIGTVHSHIGKTYSPRPSPEGNITRTTASPALGPVIRQPFLCQAWPGSGPICSFLPSACLETQKQAQVLNTDR